MPSYHSRSNYRSSYKPKYPKQSYGRSSRSRGFSQTIDPSRFIKTARPVVETEAYKPTNSFADFDVQPLLKNNLAEIGYNQPTPIQDQAIPHALIGKDIIGVAHTGTGKTAAFAVPMLNNLMTHQNSRALVVAPTRELAQQIEAECRKIAQRSGLNSAILIGGSSMGLQLRDLRNSPRIIIGTPGRIKDHLQRRSLSLSAFNIVVLDEVDRMLDMGFINDIRAILSQAASPRQSFFFSATLDSKVKTLISTFSNDPVTILLKTTETSDLINQDVVRFASSNDKLDKLHDLLLKNEVQKAIVFDETQRSVDRLGKELLERGFSADSIHGGKTQGQRQRALSKFKNNEISILVATDVAARGIDVVDITHVINYSQPKVYDDYIHRIGRAGRAGKAGYALTFIPGSH